MTVEPVELVEVEDGGRGGDALEGKDGGEFGEGEGLCLAVLGAPAKEGQVVGEGFGEVAHLAEGGDGGCAVALGEALAVGAEDGGEMGELGDGPAECLVDGHLLGGVGDVVVASDDMGDAHEGIVDGDDVVVDGDPGGDAGGGSNKNGIADGFGGELDGASDNVVEAEGVVFDPEADGIGHAGGEIFVDGFLGQGAAAT